RLMLLRAVYARCTCCVERSFGCIAVLFEYLNISGVSVLFDFLPLLLPSFREVFNLLALMDDHSLRLLQIQQVIDARIRKEATEIERYHVILTDESIISASTFESRVIHRLQKKKAMVDESPHSLHIFSFKLDLPKFIRHILRKLLRLLLVSRLCSAVYAFWCPSGKRRYNGFDLTPCHVIR